MTPITITEVNNFSEMKETTSVVVEAEVEVAQISYLYRQKVDAVADEEQDAVAKVVLNNFLAPTQTTSKNWLQVRMQKPK